MIRQRKRDGIFDVGLRARTLLRGVLQPLFNLQLDNLSAYLPTYSTRDIQLQQNQIAPHTIRINDERSSTTARRTAASVLTTGEHPAQEFKRLGRDAALRTGRGLALHARSVECRVCTYILYIM